MLNKIVKGCMINMDTGEVYSGEFYLLRPGNEMTTIVKILGIHSFLQPNNSMQVSVDCLGLDCVGRVFELTLEYTPTSVEQRNKLVHDLTPDSIFSIKGIYAAGEFGTPEGFFLIFDAIYLPVEPAFSEDKIREVFRVKGEKWEEKLP